jgi:hypothetical protein
VSSVSSAHRDEWIEGLGGARVRELGVDLVTDDSSNVVGSISGERMGEGPGKGGPAIGSTATTGSGMGIGISSPAGGRETTCTSSLAGVGTTSSAGSVIVASDSEEHTYGRLVKRRDAWQRCEGHD